MANGQDHYKTNREIMDEILAGIKRLNERVGNLETMVKKLEEDAKRAD